MAIFLCDFLFMKESKNILFVIQNWYGYLTLIYVGSIIIELCIATSILHHVPTVMNAYLPDGSYMEASDLSIHFFTSFLFIFLIVLFIPYVILSIVLYLEDTIHKKKLFLSASCIVITFFISVIINHILPSGTLTWLSD